MRRFAVRLILCVLALALIAPPSLHAGMHGGAGADLVHHHALHDAPCLPDDPEHDHADHSKHKAPAPLSAAQCALACASVLPQLPPPPMPATRVAGLLVPIVGNWLELAAASPPERPPRVVM